MGSAYKVYVYILLMLAIPGIAGCPRRDRGNQPEQVYHMGSWAGTITVTARLVRKPALDYWNAAWRMEADVRLDEYQDGSVKGTATGDLFKWEKYDSVIRQYAEITGGHWDKFSTFTIDLTGRITDQGYELTATALPTTLPDPNRQGGMIQFWDFLFPKVVQGEWPSDGSRVMQGESIRTQGNDLETTAVLRDYRESEVKYTWSIRKL